MANNLLCPYCGSKIREKTTDDIQACPICTREFVYAQAKELSEKGIDTKELINLRKEIEYWTNRDDLDKIMKYASDIIDVVVDDYIANYLVSYVEFRKDNNEKILKFLNNEFKLYVFDDLAFVVNHLFGHFDITIYDDVQKYLYSLNVESTDAWVRKLAQLKDDYLQQLRIAKALEQQKKIDDYISTKDKESIIDVTHVVVEEKRTPIAARIVLFVFAAVMFGVAVYVQMNLIPAGDVGYAWVFALCFSLGFISLLLAINTFQKRRKK